MFYILVAINESINHVMDCTIAQLYEHYTKAHPEHPVSATTFYMQRPVHVKDKPGAKYVGCLCEYCENISLKVQAINKLQPGTFRNEYDVAACTMCKKPSGEKFFRPQCIQRKCRKCGIAKLDEKLQGIMSQRNKVIWQRWKIVTTMYHGQKRFQKNQKDKTYSERGQCNHACKGTQRRGSNFR